MGTVKYTGPVASFHCPTEATIRSLKVHFSPKQLGEGTPSPENVREIVGWDGVEVEHTKNNLAQFEPYGTGGINLKWSVPKSIIDTSSLIRYSIYIDNSNGTSEACIRVAFFDINGNRLQSRTRSSGVPVGQSKRDYFTIQPFPSGTDYVVFGIKGNNFNIKEPMIDIFQNNAFKETPYEPYRGSTTDYEFGVLGKNKFPLQSTNQFLNISTGNSNKIARDMTTGDVYVNISSNNYWQGRSSKIYGISIDDGAVSFHTNDKSYGVGIFVPVLPNTTYTLSHSNFGGKTRIGYFDIAGQHLNVNLSKDTDSITFTTNSETAFILVVFCSTTGDDIDYTVSNIQLELGSTATAYEPYDPNRTVYGGWVDLISGEVCEEWKGVDSETLNWSAYSATRCSTGDLSNLIKTPDSYSSIAKLIGEQVIAGRMSMDLTNYPNAIACNPSGSLIKYYGGEFPQGKIVYELATPNTYHLAPTQLQTFLGHNNVWSNADYVEVEYDLYETQTILARKQFIMANQPHIVKPAAAPLQNFVTDMAAPLKECKIHFSPVQEGSGDPSPDNVRAISGWTGLDVYRTGKNLWGGEALKTALINVMPVTSVSNNIVTYSNNSAAQHDGDVLFDNFKQNTQYTLFLTYSKDTNTYCHIKFVYSDGSVDLMRILNLSPNTKGTGVFVSKASKTLSKITRAADEHSIVTMYCDECGLFEGVLTASDYEPYTGTAIPIAFPSITNLLNSTTITANKTLSAAGEETSETGMSLTNYIKVNEGDTYKLTFTSKEGARTRRIYGYDANKEPVESLASASWVSVDTTGTLTTTIPSGVDYIRVCYKTADEDIFLEGPESSVIYGGYVDLVTGEVWKTWDYVALDTLQWETFGGNGVFYNSSIRRKVGNPIYSNILTPTLTPGSNYTAVDPTQVFYYKTNTTYKNYLMTRNSDFSNNLNGYRQWMKDTYPGAVAFYELETPILLTTLTPTQLKTLRGTNNVYSNSNGSLELAYWTH